MRPSWVWLLALEACSGPPAQPDAAAAAPPVAAARPAELRPASPPVLYEIVGGDTLSEIAERFGVPGGAPALGVLNGIADLDEIRAGRDLLLPSTSRTGGLAPWIALPTGAPPSEPCAATTARPPEARVLPDCDEAACTEVDGWEVCTCMPSDGTPRRVLVSGRSTAQWDAPGYTGTERFEAASADVDGDGTPELVVAVHLATSNGICVVTTGVAILAEGERRPTTFTSAGFDFEGSLRAADEGCDVVTTRFESAREPRWGWGNYFVSRRYRYRDGELQPDVGGPLWGDRVAETPTVRWSEERLPHGIRTRREGTILAARVTDGGTDADALVLGVQFGAEHRRLQVAHPMGPYDSSEDSVAQLWTRGRSLPEGYAPAAPERWIGREVALETPERGGPSLLDLLPER